MACYLYEIEFVALRGLGPESLHVTVPIGMDDVEDDVPEDMVKHWAIKDAQVEMRRRGHTRFNLIEVHNA